MFPRTRISSALVAIGVALSLIVGVVSPAQALTDGRNVSPGVASSAIVRLQIGNLTCSGTLIAPQWALTARHCIPENGSAQAAIGPTIYSQTHQISDAIIHPTADLAVVRLANPSSAGTASLFGTHLQPGDWAKPAGWGGWWQNNLVIAQQSDARIERRVVNVPSPDRTAVLLEASILGGRLLPGDSGGPLFVNGQIAGVLSMSTSVDQPGQDGTMGWYVPVAEHLDWISRQTGIHNPGSAKEAAPLIDATQFPSQVPYAQIQNIPATGISLIDGTVRSVAVGSS